MVLPSSVPWGDTALVVAVGLAGRWVRSCSAPCHPVRLRQGSASCRSLSRWVHSSVSSRGLERVFPAEFGAQHCACEFDFLFCGCLMPASLPNLPCPVFFQIL